MIRIINNNLIELLFFLIFLLYFFIWSKFNYVNVNLNNNSLDKAIDLYNYNPYISNILFIVSEKLNLTYFLGFILFPSILPAILYKIFYRILNIRLWAISITLLSMSGTENYPFFNFFYNLIDYENILQFTNRDENFEIMGFPLPSFSIFYFCLVYYLSLRILKINFKNLYLLTFLWVIGPLIHPLDGFLGLIFWNFFIIMSIKIKKLKINNNYLIFLVISNFIIFFQAFYQLDLNQLEVTEDQSYKLYNFIVYFFIPIISMVCCLNFLKIDFYEFFQKFLSIYILMFLEFILIITSLLGYGFDLKMLETRITMFLLHFLYYIPPIYYLSRDNFFIFKNSEKKIIKMYSLKFLTFLFKKLNRIYLPIFSILIISYFVLSIKL